MMFKREVQSEKHNHTVEESYKRIKKTKQEIQKKSRKLREILCSDGVCLPQEVEETEENEDN